MTKDLVKRFVTKDGNNRINIYCDEYAENPRINLDLPIHFEDYNRCNSIMIKEDRADGSEIYCAKDRLALLLYNYGKKKKIIDYIANNDVKRPLFSNKLIFKKSEKKWFLYSIRGNDSLSWEWDFDERKYDIDIDDLLSECKDDTLNFLAVKCLTDKVKLASYNFDYYGKASFSSDVDACADGLVWLEKDEYLKYSGCSEEYWNNHTIFEIIGDLLDEIEAWSCGDVYGYEVEKAIRAQVTKTYFNGEREDESYIETSWEKEDSCYGFYGDLDKIQEEIIQEAGFKLEDLTED